MKITKRMGEACLDAADCAPGNASFPARMALVEIGWTIEDAGDRFFDEFDCASDHSRLAFAMCAAIAGVKP